MLRPQELDRQYAPVVTTDVWSATRKLFQRCATPPLTSAVCCWVLVQQRVRGLTLPDAPHVCLTLGASARTGFQSLCARNDAFLLLSRCQFKQTPCYPSASKPLTNNHGYTVPIGYNSFVKSARSLHPRPERREPGQGHHHRLPVCTDSSSTPCPPESYRSYRSSLLFGRGCSDRRFGCGCSVP